MSSINSNFSEGDIFYTMQDNKYCFYKMIAPNFDANKFHIISYKKIDKLIQKTEIDLLEISEYHFKADRNLFKEATYFDEKILKSTELSPYHNYLRETEQGNLIVDFAIDYFNKALKLTDEKKYLEAIDEYTKAIDLLPSFYEALDNRAFCKMDLGLWNDAILDFNESLFENSNSALAELSIGECFFNLKNYEMSKTHFENAAFIEPNNPIVIDFLEKLKSLE
jgi:tetratricopeptide (TPR) repeat protein